ncbi:Myb-like DNA-binding domain containing protein [Histomonas meleagridis]|uniref:Myb-like DNA-binding domain containing protein n=1 Tax=Histomonas meleagridis TaxID=135588 RepID=UPI0035595A62|nr:Myb-like DNA-binding domain containing protein [Histomonas meleagridis]KAH0799538.1 Myb-like DNA-binding domain containing protein [Histomonas meleagridis]
MELAALAPTRNRKQQVYSSSKKTIWTQEEDELLTRLMTNNQTNSWSVLAKYFPNKTAPQISGRWEKVLNPQLVKGSWKREEDEIILNFVQKNGVKDWAKLALLLNGRTGKQCRERFKNHLDSSVKRTPWTQEEDERLIECHNKLGNQWTKITRFFPGRTDNCIKNRWNSTLRKRIERMQNGEPLVQKRGRKPKANVIPTPEIEVVNISQYEQTEACSSPFIGNVQSKIIQLAPIAFEPFSSFRQNANHPQTICPSLEQSRNDFQKLLSARAAN